MARSKKAVQEAPDLASVQEPGEVQETSPKLPGKRRVRVLKSMTYFKGRFYAKGEELEVTEEEFLLLKGYVMEV